MPRRARRDCEDNPLEKGEFAPNIQKDAEKSIRTFFGDKSWFCGGPIPQSELQADWAVKIVLRTHFDEAVFRFIHEECLAKIPADPSYKDPSVPWTVHTLLSLLDGMRSYGISKDFQPGLLLLYFKFCKGLKIPPPPLL